MKRLSAAILALGCLAVGYGAGAGVENLRLDPGSLPEYSHLVGALYVAGAALAAAVTTWALLRLRRRGKKAEPDAPRDRAAELLAELEG